MTIAAGELRHRVEIQRRATSQDSAGERSIGWVRVGTVWASVEPKVGGESVIAGTSTMVTIFGLRYFPGLSPANRLVWNSKVFDVTSVQDVDGLHVEHVVAAKELVGVAP